MCPPGTEQLGTVYCPLPINIFVLQALENSQLLYFEQFYAFDFFYKLPPQEKKVSLIKNLEENLISRVMSISDNAIVL